MDHITFSSRLRDFSIKIALFLFAIILLTIPISRAQDTTDSTTFVLLIPTIQIAQLDTLTSMGADVVAQFGDTVILIADHNHLDYMSIHEIIYQIQKSYPSPTPQLGSIILSNGRVSIDIEDNGTFTMWRSSDNNWLLYPSAGTGYFSVNVDGYVYSHRSNTLPISSPLAQIDQNTASITYLVHGGILITQVFKLEGDAVGFYVSVGNSTSASHAIKIRYLLDTQIDINDGSPLYAPPVGTRTYETEVLPLNFTSWEAWLTPVNPGMKGIGTLSNMPARMVFAWWPNAYNYSWDYTPNPNQRFYTPGYTWSPYSDGCVLLYFDFGSVPAFFQTVPMRTYYGIGLPTGGSERLKLAIKDLHLAMKDYLIQTLGLYSHSTSRAYRRVVEDSDIKSIAIDLVKSLAAGDIATITRRFAIEGAIKGADEALKSTLKSLVKSGLSDVFPAALASLLEDIDPTWTEAQIENKVYSELLSSQGWSLGGTQNGVQSLLDRLENHCEAAIGSVPEVLPQDYPLDQTLNSIQRMTDALRRYTPWNKQPGNEGQMYWHVPSICNFQLNPINPMFFGTSSNAARLINNAVTVYDVEQTIHEIRTYFCIGWTGGGAVVKGVALIGGVTELPAEGIYWSGIGVCSIAGTILDGADLGTRLAILYELWDTDGRVASDLMTTRNFYESLLDDVVAALNAPGGTSNYYACSPNMDVLSVSVPDLNLGILDPTGAGTAYVSIKNNSNIKTGTAQVFLEALKGEQVIGVYPSQQYSIQPLGTQQVPIDFEVPNSSIFLSDHYTAKFVIMTSAGVFTRLSTFKVCSPIACFVDNPTEILTGILEAGQSAWSSFWTQASDRVVDFVLAYPGSDLDLHIYDQFGNHTGMNYQTGRWDLNIPGSHYSGPLSNPEIVSITNPGVQQFSIQVLGVTTFGPESYSVMAIEESDHPATLVASPSKLFYSVQAPDTVSNIITLAEIGGHHALTDLSVTVTDLQTRHGKLVPSSHILVSLPSTSILPDSFINCSVSAWLSSGTPLDTFTGTVSFSSSGNSIDIPVILVPVSTTGSISGMISDSLIGLYGVSVDLHDSSGSLIRVCSSDELGSYNFDSLSVGTYMVSIVKPLGFGAVKEASFINVTAGADSLVNFYLFKLPIISSQRSMGYWKHQVDVYLSGKGKAQESLAAMSSNMDRIRTHFNNNLANSITVFQVPQPATQIDSLKVLQSLLTVNQDGTMNERAKQQLIALILNVVSSKLSQITKISDDSATVSQAITYCNQLITDADYSNDEIAKDIADYINNGLLVPAGIIPLTTPNIMYKSSSDDNFVDAQEMPKSFKLFQNYPNPFNATTEVKYALPKDCQVRIVIYNIQGQKTRTLVNEYQTAGYKSVKWDSRDDAGNVVASGIYFYKLQVGEYAEARKMVLLK